MVFSGCTGIKYNVKSNIIVDNKYPYSKKNIRIIGVYKNIPQNEKNILKSVETVLSSYKTYDNISSGFIRRNYTYVESVLYCYEKLGRHYYQHERKHRFDNCVSNKKNEIKSAKVFTGNSLKLINDEQFSKIIEFVDTSGELINQSSVKIKTEKTDDYIIIYLKNRPRGLSIKHFINLNNKLIQEFKKNNLNSLKLKIVEF